MGKMGMRRENRSVFNGEAQSTQRKNLRKTEEKQRQRQEPHTLVRRVGHPGGRECLGAEEDRRKDGREGEFAEVR